MTVSVNYGIKSNIKSRTFSRIITTFLLLISLSEIAGPEPVSNSRPSSSSSSSATSSSSSFTPRNNNNRNERNSNNNQNAELYLAVAYTSRTESVVTRAVNRTLISIAPELLTSGIKLSPLYTLLPDNFSPTVLSKLCDTWHNNSVLAVLILAEQIPGFAPALAAVGAGIPVLWATGEIRHGYLEQVVLSPYELRLEAGPKDALKALRSLLLTAHWHTFTLIYTGLPLPTTAVAALREPPLLPTLLPLREDANPQTLFRLLSEISRATKGVVVLISTGKTVKRIMKEAERLNMVDGNFVWVWLDSSAAVLPKNLSWPSNIVTVINSGESIINEPNRKRKARSNLFLTTLGNNSSSSNNNNNNNTKNYNTNETDLNLLLGLNNIKYNSFIGRNVLNNNVETPINVNKLNNGINNNNNNNKNEKMDYITPKNIITPMKDTLTELSAFKSPILRSSSPSSFDMKISHESNNNNNNSNRKKTIRNVDDSSNIDKKVDIDITKYNNNNMKYKNKEELVDLKKFNQFLHLNDHLFNIYFNKLCNSYYNSDIDIKNCLDNRNIIIKQFIIKNNNLFLNLTKKDMIIDKLISHNQLIKSDDDDNKIKNNNNKIGFKPLEDVNHNLLNLIKSSTVKSIPSNLFEEFFKFKSFNQSKSVNNNNIITSDKKRNVRSVNKNISGTKNNSVDEIPPLPVGLLALRPVPLKIDRHLIRSAVKIVVESLKRAVRKKCYYTETVLSPNMLEKPVHCWKKSQKLQEDFTSFFLQELGTSVGDALGGKNTNNDTVSVDKMAARFHILNLVPEKTTTHNSSNERQESREWRWVGEIIGHSAVKLESVVWPGGHLVPASTPRGARSVFRVVTALAPPFVMEGELDEDGQCLRGLECHRLLTSDKDNLTLVFNEMDRLEDAEDNVDMNQKYFWGMSVNYHPRYRYLTSCCYGLAMDLLENIAQELEFDFHLYLVADGMHGSRTPRPDGGSQWNGIVGDLVSGAAHMSFAALSVSSPRSEVIDFSVPYFFSGVSFLASPDKRTDIPLLAFLLPFSSELWIAIFTSLNVTAVAVAIYEWLSPFGLNPWGRQRSKNFSMSSALWVCWGLLCGHLVAFKAPKSWPNKFLINVWGGFSVIFVASYTANIAALIAGLFFHNSVGDYHDRSLLSQRVGTPKASAADYYVHKANQLLWEHMQRYSVKDVAEGVQHLKNGSLDILIADTPILDYYRATDHGCKLQKIGDTINEDTYAVGMTKGFPLKDSISAVIAKYSSNGYMDILQEKWYGGLPCFKLVTEMAQPRPLGVAAVAVYRGDPVTLNANYTQMFVKQLSHPIVPIKGVFLLLGLGMVVGCLILLAEHLFYRYTLPILRHKPKGTIWRSRNIMFFSQKLYRFINCVELVSPHHAARELVHTIRQGQITSLFQKSVKRKEHEQRRRRKSKAQFFEMIQEIRRVQQEERVSSLSPPHLSLPVGEKGKNSPRMKKSQQSKSPTFLSPPDQQRRNSKLPTRLELARRLSRDVFRSKSSGNLRRMGSDISMAAGRFLDCHSSQAIGRRLSRDTNNSPPDINSRRASYLSDNRRLHSSDIGSASDLSAPPRSPNYLTAKPSLCTVIPAMQSFDYSTDNILTPSSLMPKSPDIIGTSKKFSYVDVKSPSFKNKLSKFHDTSSSSVDINPKVIIHSDNQTRDKWANSSINTTEHLIEIIIPPEKESSLKNSVEQKHPLNFVLDELKERQKEGALSTPVTLEKPTSSPTALTPTSDTLPKIVSYIPKKPIRKSESVGGAGSSESGTKSGGVTKKERRRAVHKFRSEDYSGGEDVCSSIIFPRKKCEKNDRSPCGKCDLCERTRGDKDGNTSPLSRLSREELLSLSQIPDTELKQHLLQAIEDKESPSVNFINKT